MPWSQNYNPLHFWPLSTAMAAVPVLTRFFVLLVLNEVTVGAEHAMVVLQLTARRDSVDQSEPGERTVAHRDGDGKVELNYRRRLDTRRLVVRLDDPSPVRRRGAPFDA
jgi:hypothetical protein